LGFCAVSGGGGKTGGDRAHLVVMVNGGGGRGGKGLLMFRRKMHNFPKEVWGKKERTMRGPLGNKANN